MNDSNLPTLSDYIENMIEPEEKLYALVDGAQDLAFALSLPGRFDRPILSLFDEPGASRLRDVTPYLAHIEIDNELLSMWAERLQDNLGILLLSKAEPEEMRTHLRTLFRVTDEEGEEYFFRFYDPRVLRTFLPTCDTKEIKEFFGPVRCMIVAAEKTECVFVTTLSKEDAQSIEQSLLCKKYEANSGENSA